MHSCSNTFLPHCYFAPLFSYTISISPHCYLASLLSCLIAALPHCYLTSLLSCLIAISPNCYLASFLSRLIPISPNCCLAPFLSLLIAIYCIYIHPFVLPSNYCSFRLFCVYLYILFHCTFPSTCFQSTFPLNIFFILFVQAIQVGQEVWHHKDRAPLPFISPTSNSPCSTLYY